MDKASIKIVLPNEVATIIRTLTEHGYEAYAVGGCVRDSILGRKPGDWDITTSALPEQVKALFRRTIDTGIQHGTVTVMFGKNGFEVTTYRIDGAYEDARHPKNVEFTSRLEEDLKRRDFTINAMAYNDDSGVVDVFDGLGDLDRGIIRCVGDADDRFGEDALRILRAVRFSAQLGFEIEDKTSEAIMKLAPTLEKISKERIHTELNKMLKSVHPEYFLQADGLGIMQVIMPEYHALNREQKLFGGKMAAGCACELPERYAAMLLFAGEHEGTECTGIHQNASEVCRRVLRELKLDNATIDTAALLANWCGMELTEDESRLRHTMYEAGPQNIIRILDFRLAYERARDDKEQIQSVIKVRELCQRIIERGDCLSLKELKITGRDLLELGIPAGKRLGAVLNALLMAVLDDQALNTAKELADRARCFIMQA